MKEPEEGLSGDIHSGQGWTSGGNLSELLIQMQGLATVTETHPSRLLGAPSVRILSRNCRLPSGHTAIALLMHHMQHSKEGSKVSDMMHTAGVICAAVQGGPGSVFIIGHKQAELLCGRDQRSCAVCAKEFPTRALLRRRCGLRGSTRRTGPTRCCWTTPLPPWAQVGGACFPSRQYTHVGSIRAP